MKRILVIFICLFFSAGCSTKPQIVRNYYQDAGTSQQHNIYVLSHGWHTGIVVNAEDLNKLIPSLSQRFAKAGKYEIGWGDQGFYQAKEITTGLTLRAVFWPTPTVIHVVGLYKAPALSFPKSEVEKLTLSHESYSNLLEFLKSSFFFDDNSEPVSLRKGIYGDSQFYRAVGTYYLFNTCNKWTAKGLASAGFDISTFFKLSSESVISYVKKQNRN